MTRIPIWTTLAANGVWPHAAPPAAPTPMQAQPVMAPKAQTTVLPAYLDPKTAISIQRSVYFDYDDFTVKPEFAQTLEMHGKYLAANPKISIRVEGNADERGSAEYNLALGHDESAWAQNRRVDLTYPSK